MKVVPMLACIILIACGGNFPKGAVNQSPVDSSVITMVGDSLLKDDHKALGILFESEWKKNIGNTCYTSPVVKDTIVYSVCDGFIYALNLLNGKEYWSNTIGLSEPANSTIVTASGIVAVRTDEGVQAFDAKSGMKKWRQRFDTLMPGRNIIADQSSFYFMSSDKKAVKANAVSGNITWTAATAPGVSRIFASSNKVCFSKDSIVYVLDQEKGTAVGQMKLSAAVSDILIAADGTVFAGTKQGELYAFDKVSLKTLWLIKPENSSIDIFQLQGDTLFFSGLQGVAVNKNTGKVLWKSDLGGSVSNPVFISPFILFYQDGIEEQSVLSVMSAKNGQELYRSWNDDLDNISLLPSSGEGGRRFIAADFHGNVYSFRVK